MIDTPRHSVPTAGSQLGNGLVPGDVEDLTRMVPPEPIRVIVSIVVHPCQVLPLSQRDESHSNGRTPRSSR